MKKLRSTPADSNPPCDSVSFTPPYPPTPINSSVKNQGYLWAYYATLPEVWSKYNIANPGNIQGFFTVTDEQTCRELIADQIKKKILLNQSYFYVYPISAPMNFNASDAVYGLSLIDQTIIYSCIQLARYRNYATFERMLRNLAQFITLMTTLNIRIKQPNVKSTDFRRLGNDNDFTEMLTAELSVSGLLAQPFANCLPL